MSRYYRRYSNRNYTRTSYAPTPVTPPVIEIKNPKEPFLKNKFAWFAGGLTLAFVVASAYGEDLFWTVIFFEALVYGVSWSIWEKSKERKVKKKSKFEHLVTINISNDIEKEKQKLNVVKAELDKLELEQVPSPEIPYWNLDRFTHYRPPAIRESYKQMLVEDIDLILKIDNLTWTDNENSILSNKCDYPSNPPTLKVKEFNHFPLVSVSFPEATIEYDASIKNKESIKKLFQDEHNKVSEHNSKREELINLVEEINAKIENYNVEYSKKWQKYEVEARSVFDNELAKYKEASGNYKKECTKEKSEFNRLIDGYKLGKKEDFTTRFNYVLAEVGLPYSVPHIWDIDYNSDEGIAIIEIGLPDVVHNPPLKEVELKSGNVKKPLSIKEKSEIVPRIHPAIMLRIAYEIFRNDFAEKIKLLVLNGWVKFDDPTTGKNTKAFTSSLMVTREQIVNLNLSKLEPLSAFLNLKGKSAGKLIEIIPITPVMSLDKKDGRFIATSEVLNKLGSETNLASMDWQDFESLIAELFEKEFAKEGAEVKVTQASRDRGVDAVIFDPDPIRGGKIIVQAKRYANTVDVSAVRDLCAVVKKEGAIKGILVTTSTYGGDAYKFANNEPVTLLNGAELLGLLKKHGYTFRINLEEAKKLNLANNLYTKN